MSRNKLISLNKEIKNNNIKNIYCFCGNEFYLIDLYLKKFIKSLNIDIENQFSYLEIKNVEVDFNIIIDYISTFPLFSNKKILLIYENFNLNNLFFKKILNIQKNVYIFFITKDKKNFDILIKNKITNIENIYEFDTLKDNELLIWIEKKFIFNKITINKNVCEYLIFCCKKSMYNLKNEIDKIIIYILYNNILKEVTLDLIDNICYKIFDAKIFEIINPIMNKNYLLTFSLIKEFKDLNYDEIKIFNFILGYFKKIYLIKLNINENNQNLIKLINTKSLYYLNIIKKQTENIEMITIKQILTILFNKEFIIKQAKNKNIIIEYTILNIINILNNNIIY